VHVSEIPLVQGREAPASLTVDFIRWNSFLIDNVSLYECFSKHNVFEAYVCNLDPSDRTPHIQGIDICVRLLGRHVILILRCREQL